MPLIRPLVAYCTGALLGAGTIALVAGDRPLPAAARDYYTHVMERKLAAQVARGSAVIVEGNLDEPALRWKIAERIATAPEVAIFGSSHSLRVGSALLGTPRTMNFSISGAAIVDHLVVTEILATRGIRPRTWIVFLDPWVFDIGADFGAWRQRADDARRIEARLAENASPRPEPIFTRSLAQHAERESGRRYTLDPLLHRLDGWVNEVTRTTYAADTGSSSATLLLADGSIQPAADRPAVSAEEGRRNAENQFASNADRHRYGNYERMDADLWTYLESWLRDCRRDGGNVWIVLSPYHPAIYPKITASPNNKLAEIEARVHARFDGQSNLRVIGSYDPARAGVAESDFYDGDHLQESGLRKLLEPITAARGGSAN